MVSYDGDPSDILVLGPALPAGEIVRGVIVGVMYMEDKKGLDFKFVLSLVTTDGRTKFEVTPQIRNEIGEFFRRYRRGRAREVLASTKVGGTVSEGRDLVTTTHVLSRVSEARRSALSSAVIEDTSRIDAHLPLSIPKGAAESENCVGTV